MSTNYNIGLNKQDELELVSLFGQLRIDPKNDGFTGFVHRVLYFNKFVDEATFILTNDTKSHKSRLKKVYKRLCDFEGIIFDCNRVGKLLDALVSFAKKAKELGRFEMPCLQKKFDAIVERLFKNELSPIESLTKGEALKDVSSTIAGKFLELASYHSNKSVFVTKKEKRAEKIIRRKLSADYTVAIKKIDFQLRSITDPALLAKEMKVGEAHKKLLQAEIARLDKGDSVTKGKKEVKETQEWNKWQSFAFLFGIGA